jgi:hypothetical protein
MPKVEQVITAKDQASGVLKGFTGSMIKAQLSVEALKMAARELVKIGQESIDKFVQQEKAETSLNAALQITGKYSDATAKELQKLASDLQGVTEYGDEASLSALALTQQLADLSEDQLKAVLPRIQDFSAALRVDLNTAASLFGKTIGSSTNALARYGIEIDTGLDKSEKFEQLMSQLDSKFGGFAQTVGDTTAGDLAQLDNAIGDLAESFGELLIDLAPAIDMITGAIGAIKDYVDTLNKVNPAMINHYSEILEKMVEDGYSVEDAIKNIAEMTGKSTERAEELYLVNEDLRATYEEQRRILEEQKTISSEIVANMLEALGKEQDRIQAERDRQTEAEKWLSDYTGYLNEIETELDKVEERRSFAELMGEDFDYIAEKTKVLEKAIGSLIDNGYSLEGDTIKGLMEEYRELTNLYGSVADDHSAMAETIETDNDEIVSSFNRVYVGFDEIEKKSDETSDDMEDDWRDTFKTIMSLAGEFLGQFGSIIGKMGDIVSLEYQNQIDALERSLEQQLDMIDEWAQQQMELYGVAEETRQEQLEREVGELEDAIAEETDAEEKARLQKQLEEKKSELLRQQILDEAAEKKKEAEKKAAMEKWKLEVQQFKAEQSYKKAQTWIDYGAGLTAAAGRAAGMGFILGPIYMAAMTGLLSTNLGISLGYINKQQPPPKPTFENSGIVPGSSYHGDNVDISANSREMYLNLNDQASLLNMIKRGSGGGMNIGTINLPNVKNAEQFVKELKEIQRRERVLA